MADSLRLKDDGAISREDYLIKQPLWQAFESQRPVVVLIDEIDKAPRDFPNDLLTELDQWIIRIDDVAGKS